MLLGRVFLGRDKNSGSQFQDQNFHATNEKLCDGVKGLPFFFPLWVGGLVGTARGFVSKLCLVWRVDCSLSTWTEDFPCKILFFGGGGAAGGVKAISFQVSDMFPKMFPLAPHFYPVCFGKCCPSFTYIYLSQREGALNF